MITVPNTLGVFEERILDIAKMVHEKGAYLYLDGANFNAFVGKVRPGRHGRRRHAHEPPQDVLDAARRRRPGRRARRRRAGARPVPAGADGRERAAASSASTTTARTRSGRCGRFYGNFGVLVRALTYILSYGNRIHEVAENAVLNANYIRKKLEPFYHLKYDAPSYHEVVFDDKKQAAQGLHNIDVAKRLMDYGFHPPTMSFPLIVPGALMIEPTESEPKEELDAFVDAMIAIAKECETSPGGRPRRTAHDPRAPARRGGRRPRGEPAGSFAPVLRAPTCAETREEKEKTRFQKVKRASGASRLAAPRTPPLAKAPREAGHRRLLPSKKIFFSLLFSFSLCIFRSK